MWSMIKRGVKNWFNKIGSRQFRLTEWCRKKYYKRKGYSSYMINITTGRKIWELDPSMDAEIDGLDQQGLRLTRSLRPQCKVDYAAEANKALRTNS